MIAKYDVKPDTLIYDIYSENQIIATAKSDNGLIRLPDKKGIMTRVLKATWNEKNDQNFKGTSVTTFKVELGKAGGRVL